MYECEVRRARKGRAGKRVRSHALRAGVALEDGDGEVGGQG